MTTFGESQRAEMLALIAAEASIDPAVVQASTTVASLGVSSLDLIEIIFRLESEYGIEIPTDGPLGTPEVTVFALIDHVLEIVASKAAAVSSDA